MAISSDDSEGYSSLSDWLEIHQISASEVKKVLLQAAKHLQPYQDIPAYEYVDITPEDAWSLASLALKRIIPSAEELIDDVKNYTEVNFSLKNETHKIPFTLDRGSNTYPYVYIPFHRKTTDIINTAHEFGHAVQLVASEGKFLPPIAREICAFLSELALLEYLEEHETELHEKVHHYWKRDDHTFLHNDAQALVLSIDQPNNKYDYRWSYVIARFIANNLYYGENLISFWAILQDSSETLSQLLSRALLHSQKRQRVNNLPKFPELSKKYPKFYAYQSLGMLALLDIENGGGNALKNIEDYANEISSHMHKENIWIFDNDEKKPIGYTIWENGNEKQLKRITYAIAPFGDRDTLKKKLKSHFPHGTKLIFDTEI